ncbi:septal ring lytic transglycosylase RlpA family lipoprotein, partial [Mesorhizobium sp. M00.F.Ca.ET.149.01.1.1]
MKKTNQTALVAVTIAAGLMAGASSAAAQCGRASWYALHSRTASGERMNPSALTAAH